MLDGDTFLYSETHVGGFRCALGSAARWVVAYMA